jgi:hypothetical protein
MLATAPAEHHRDPDALLSVLSTLALLHGRRA